MEENKRIADKNIKFEYADKVASHVNREDSMINNLNSWLGPFADEINAQDGSIVVYFQNNREQRVSFDGISEQLQTILYRQLDKFLLPDNRRSDSPGK
ncbi:MAG TPA: hypothetical protein VKR41_00450 [Puia sp.]|nr:hypothetical protein [Puia sp.]